MSHIHDSLRRPVEEELLVSPGPPYSTITAGALFAVIGRRRKAFTLVAGLFFLTSAVIIFTLPKKYEAEMKLLVKNERQDLVVSPENNVNTVHASEISETQINSEIELIRSTDVLREVVFQARLSQTETGTVLAAGGLSPISVDKALKVLEHDLSISPVKKSSIIDITYTSQKPEVASQVLRYLADNFLMAHLKVHANPGTFLFFDQQAKAYHAALTSSEVQLREFREKYSALGMPGQNDILANRSMQAQAELEDVDAQIAGYKLRIKQSQQALNSLSPRIVTQTRTIPQSQLVESLGQTLLQLQNRRTELITKFNPGDRLVNEVTKQIADTSEALDRARAQTAEERTADTNPVHETVEEGMVSDQIALSGLRARRKSLATVVKGYKQKMFGLADATVQHQSLVRQVQENEEKYLLYQKKREEARIAESLDKDRITNVAVIQAPTTPIRPVGPRVKVDLLLSAICALFIASITVLLMEFLSPNSGTPFSTRTVTGASAN